MANNNIYGFVSLQDLYDQRVSSVGLERVYSAINETLAEYTNILNEIMAAWVVRTTVAQIQFELPGSGTLQPLDEWGNPLPVQPSGSYQVAFPIQGGGTAFGDNRVSRAMLTVEEVARMTDDATRRDKDWMIRHILAALYTPATWPYFDKVGADGSSKGLGNITIQPLANGDSVVYGRKAFKAAATDNHYLAQANAIDDANNPFPTIRTELAEHPSNSGPYVAYVPSNLVTSIGGLTEFVEAGDPDINLGANADTVTNPGAQVLGPGQTVLGKTKSGVWVVEMEMLPDNYMLAFALGAGPVLRMREYPAAELQGLFPEYHSPDGNVAITRLLRYTGFGVANRVGALAYRIGNAAYGAGPTGYIAPLAV